MPSHDDAAAGPDGVPSQLLKQCSSSIVKPLCILFNKSMNEGTIPALLKKATTVSMYKYLSNRTLKEKLLSILSEAGLKQMQREPTRGRNLPDLFCCNKPSLV